MKFIIIIIGLLGLLLYGTYMETSQRSAAMCVLSGENANGESEDIRYMLRLNDNASPGTLRKVTREEYAEKNSGPISCDASYSYTAYVNEVGNYMALNGGYYIIITNGTRTLNKITIGFGDTKLAAQAHALKKND